MSFGIKRNSSPVQCFANFDKIYFVSLVVVKIIRRFGFGPIYTKLIVTIVVAQAIGLFSSTPGLFHWIDFGVGLCWVVLVCIPFKINKKRKYLTIYDVIYPVYISLFCLSHSFVYLLYFCPNWERS